MSRSRLSLSLDLDNLWSYMKTHGDPGWERFPSYLDTVAPRFLDLLDRHSMKITVFVVGQDAAIEENQAALRAIAAAGHEIGNHSFHHQPWLHLYSEDEIAAEIERAERSIEAATGMRPKGFRGPGYSLSKTVLRVLKARGYDYDCSTFPTLIGPLARTYYFLRARLNDEQMERRSALFGHMADGLRPNAPYAWDLDGERLVEIPVTTMPFFKVPIHFSYVHWLAGWSELAATAYFAASLRFCDLVGIEPSLLLHPLDFMGGDDLDALRFFPGMNQNAAKKMARMDRLLEHVAKRYQVERMAECAARLASGTLPVRRPDFRQSEVPSMRAAHEEAARR